MGCRALENQAKKGREFSLSLTEEQLSAVLSNLKFVISYDSEIDWILSPVVKKFPSLIISYLLESETVSKVHSFGHLHGIIVETRKIAVPEVMDIVFSHYIPGKLIKSYKIIEEIYPDYFSPNSNHNYQDSIDLDQLSNYLINKIVECPEFVIDVLHFCGNFLKYSNNVYVKFFELIKDKEKINMILKNLLGYDIVVQGYYSNYLAISLEILEKWRKDQIMNENQIALESILDNINTFSAAFNKCKSDEARDRNISNLIYGDNEL